MKQKARKKSQTCLLENETEKVISSQDTKKHLNAYLSELTLLIKTSLKRIFPDDIRIADITPIFKKEDDLNKENDLLPCCIIFLKHLNKFYANILIFLWKKSFHLTFAALEKIAMRSTPF